MGPIREAFLNIQIVYYSRLFQSGVGLLNDILFI